MLEKIADLPGWGPLSSQNLAESVQTVASGSVPLSRFIYSLGIRFIGTQGSQLIASSYKNIDAFLGALDKASSYNEENDEDDNVPFTLLVRDDESEKVKGIGPTALSALLAFSKEEVLMKAARDLANALTILDDESGNTSLTNTPTGGDDTNANPSPFDGMTIVFTGTLPSMSRTAAQTTVKERGAKATPNTVSKSTSLVVEGEKGGKKARQAREMGIRVIDADKFMQLLET